MQTASFAEMDEIRSIFAQIPHSKESRDVTATVGSIGVDASAHATFPLEELQNFLL